MSYKIRERLLDEQFAHLKSVQANHKLYPTDANARIVAKQLEVVSGLAEEVEKLKKVHDSMGDLAPVTDEGGGSGLQQAYLAKGWDIQSNPKVNLGNVFGRKTMMSDGSDAQNLRFPQVAGLGQDDRFAYRHFPSVGLGDATTVSGLVQTVRTFSPSSMDVSLTGSSTKTESTITVALTTVDALMIAHVTELCANSLFKLPSFGAWITKEMSFGLGQGIDFELVRALAAASGTHTYAQGTDSLFACYRNAIKEVRASGFSPNLLILHPNDSADLDLLTDANEQFFGSGPGTPGFGKVWGLTVAETTAATEGLPIIVDTNNFGKLYFGGTEWAVNPYEEFRTNRSRGRLEVPMCVFVEQAECIQEITLV